MEKDPKSHSSYLMWFSLTGIILAAFVMVAFRYLNLSHGHTNQGLPSHLALLALVINLLSIIPCLLKQQGTFLFLAVLNFLSAVWLFTG